MPDAKRLAACERVTAEHHATGKYGCQHRVYQAADDGHEDERDRQHDEEHENPEPRRWRRAKDSPAFSPPADAVAGGKLTRLGRRGRDVVLWRRCCGLRYFHRISLRTRAASAVANPTNNGVAYAYAGRDRPAAVAIVA